MGEQWSPQTAPAIQAEMDIIAISSLIEPLNIARTIGIRIPNVPHDVPVANESPTPIRNTTAGKSGRNALALRRTNSAISIFAPSPSVIVLSVHAQQRIIIAGTIALNPSGIESIHSLKLSVLLNRKYITEKISPANEPITNPTDASAFENASTKL